MKQRIETHCTQSLRERRTLSLSLTRQRDPLRTPSLHGCLIWFADKPSLPAKLQH